jgi:hypothetical protein
MMPPDLFFQRAKDSTDYWCKTISLKHRALPYVDVSQGSKLNRKENSIYSNGDDAIRG